MKKKTHSIENNNIVILYFFPLKWYRYCSNIDLMVQLVYGA